VFEQGPFVSYASCGVPYALGHIIKDDLALVVQTPQSFKQRFNIDVYVNSEVVTVDRATKDVTVRVEGQHELQVFS